ncbi:MAG: L-2-hydroxyglutarate oxidase [Bacteroidota bacterium]
MHSSDIIIIGGGIVGLATAVQLRKHHPNLSIIIIEKEASVAIHQTGHNSGVLHSGIYYKSGSRKAKNCIDGYNQMVQFCSQHNIPYEICGKVIVATDESELPGLQTLFDRGIANRLKGLRKLEQRELKEIEPHVNGIRGIFVPQTGIVDYTAVAKTMKHILQQSGVAMHFNEQVVSIKSTDSKNIIETSNSVYESKVVISCAGLHSDRIARLTQPDLEVRIIPFRGEYYSIRKEKQYLVNNLIYPVPDPSFPFLGVHFTRMIHGGIEAGPNAVFAFKREGYSRTSFDLKDFWEAVSWPGFRTMARKYWKTGAGEFYRSLSKLAFTTALQKLIPEIQQDDLIEGGSGVRAQACSITGNLLDDFHILEEGTIIHVCNAPSPAATSSLSIGDYISNQASKFF